MRFGLAGFPGSGKTTLFNAMTGLNVPVGYGGEVRVGTVRVPDPRVDFLSRVISPKKTTYATINLRDVPGEYGAGAKVLSPGGLHVSDRRIVEALVERAHRIGAARHLPAVPLDDRIVGIQRHRRLDIAPAIHRLRLADDLFGFACVQCIRPSVANRQLFDRLCHICRCQYRARYYSVAAMFILEAFQAPRYRWVRIDEAVITTNMRLPLGLRPAPISHSCSIRDMASSSLCAARDSLHFSKRNRLNRR